MFSFIKILKKSFDDYKKDPLAIFLFGLADISTFSLTLIPIIGIFIGAYFLPRVLGWYYNKTIGNINPNYNLTFKIWLLFIFLHHLVIILFLGLEKIIEIFHFILKIRTIEDILLLVSQISLEIIFIIPIIFVLWLIFFYPAYAIMLGKTNKLEINIIKSLNLIAYTMIWNIFTLFIFYFLIQLSLFGQIISILFVLFVYQQIFNLIIANYIFLA